MISKIKGYFKDDDDREVEYEEEMEYDEYDDMGYDEDDDVDDDYDEEPFNLPEMEKKGCHMILVSPETFNETIKIANDLKKNKMVVVNLEDVEFEEGRKIVDFLSGTIYALGGSVNKISGKIIVFAPRFIEVQNTISVRRKDNGMDVPSFRR